MLWKLLQAAIFMAVVGSNIEYKWTPNGYVASFLGFCAAYVASVFLAKLIDALSGRQSVPLRRSRQQRSH